jgi:hypothetical protein
MNERIRQLVEQAPYTTISTEGRLFSQQDLAKFAELIVAECINIVKPTQHHEVWAQSYLGGVDGLELLNSKITNIKQHFGVEHE